MGDDLTNAVLGYEFDEDIVQAMRDALPTLKDLYDILELHMLAAAQAEEWGALIVLSWQYGLTSSMVVSLETADGVISN